MEVKGKHIANRKVSESGLTALKEFGLDSWIVDAFEKLSKLLPIGICFRH